MLYSSHASSVQTTFESAGPQHGDRPGAPRARRPTDTRPADGGMSDTHDAARTPGRSMPAGEAGVEQAVARWAGFDSTTRFADSQTEVEFQPTIDVVSGWSDWVRAHRSSQIFAELESRREEDLRLRGVVRRSRAATTTSPSAGPKPPTLTTLPASSR